MRSEFELLISACFDFQATSAYLACLTMKFQSAHHSLPKKLTDTPILMVSRSVIRCAGNKEQSNKKH
jgi:hypothetical protein